MPAVLILRVYDGAKGHFAARFWEWMFAFALLAAAYVFIVVPQNYFVAPTYSIISRIASPQAWGTMLLVIAFARVTALILNGTFETFRRYSPPVRSITSLLSAISWGVVILGLHQVEGNILAKIPYIVLFIGDVRLFYTVADEAVDVEREYRAKNGGGQPGLQDLGEPNGVTLGDDNKRADNLEL